MRMVLKSKYKFYLTLCGELILSPWLYFKNFMKWHFGDSKKVDFINRVRVPVDGNKLSVFHENSTSVIWFQDRIINKNMGQPFEEYDIVASYIQSKEL